MSLSLFQHHGLSLKESYESLHAGPKEKKEKRTCI